MEEEEEGDENSPLGLQTKILSHLKKRKKIRLVSDLSMLHAQYFQET